MKNKWIIWVIVAVVGFVAIAAGTVGVLTALNSKNTAQDDQNNGTQQEGGAARAAITSFTTHAATNDALSDIVIVSAQDRGTAPLYAFTDASQNKAIQFDVESYVTLRKVEGLAASDVTRVGDAIGAYLTGEGFEKKPLQGAEVIGVYVGDTATCTVMGSVGAMAMTLACEDVAKVNEQTALVETLLAKASSYDKDYSTIKYAAVTSDDKAYSLAQLTVVASDAVTIKNSLLYTAEGTTWTFVEDSLNTPLGQSGGGKAPLGEAGQKLLQDTHYEPLLMEVLSPKQQASTN